MPVISAVINNPKTLTDNAVPIKSKPMPKSLEIIGISGPIKAQVMPVTNSLKKEKIKILLSFTCIIKIYKAVSFIKIMVSILLQLHDDLINLCRSIIRQ